jgi:hypothetical protein
MQQRRPSFLRELFNGQIEAPVLRKWLPDLDGRVAMPSPEGHPSKVRHSQGALDYRSSLARGQSEWIEAVLAPIRGGCGGPFALVCRINKNGPIFSSMIPNR